MASLGNSIVAAVEKTSKDAEAFSIGYGYSSDTLLTNLAVAQLIKNADEGNAKGVISNSFAAIAGATNILGHKISENDKTGLGKIGQKSLAGISIISSGAANIIESKATEIVTNKLTDGIEHSVGTYNKAVDKLNKAIDNSKLKGSQKFHETTKDAINNQKSTQQKIQKIYQDAEKAIKDGAKNAQKTVNDALQKAQKLTQDLAKEISDIFRKLSDEIADAFDDLKQAIKDTFNEWQQKIQDFFGRLEPSEFFDWLPDNIQDWLTDLPRIGKYHIYDPLALDLNGNGTIDIIGIDGYHNALFDHDGDGIATATTWVDKQDGLLVLDKNNDGIINDGTELFGDSTKINGRLAKHGFEALASLDDNRDGVIDE